MVEQPVDSEHFDAVVIGSGFGGAVAACRLAQAGFSVLVLERGRRYQPEDFPALPDDDRIAPDLRRWVWSSEQGLWDLQDLGEIIAVQAAGYGGGSLLYANVHLRAARGAFEEGWPERFQGEALEPYYDLAAHMMNATPIAERPGGDFTKTRVFDAVAQKLGRDVLRPPLAVSYASGANAFGEKQSACTGCGRCCTGCPEGAKNTLDYNYLAVAEQNGAVARTQCEVKRIFQGASTEERARWTVEYTNHLTASSRVVTAENVFLCAGVLHSARLLHEAALRPECRSVQERVGIGYFPNADAAGMVYDTNQECFPSSGPCITTGAMHWEAQAEKTGLGQEGDRERLFLIQDGGYAPELARLLGILRAPLWNGRNRTHGATSDPLRPVSTPPEPTPFPGVALVSPLDALLDASSDPKVKRIAPAALGQSWDKFMREVERALLMPEIVASTIERSARARYELLPPWFRKLASYESWPVRKFKGAFQWFIDFAGGDGEVGHHALRGLLRGSDLDRNAYLQKMVGYDGANATRRMLLLAMGQDAAPGVLLFDEQRGMVADLDLYHLMPGYTNQELLMKDIARELGGELRLNPAWSFLGKPITVHSQGGCRMSEDADDGVTTPQGQVHGCDGLFVMDASVMCRSVGVNPTPTILAISEMNILDFIRAKRGVAWPNLPQTTPGAREYSKHVQGGRDWRKRATERSWQLRPEAPRRRVEVPLGSEPLGIRFREKFHGYVAPIDASRDPLGPLEPKTPARSVACDDAGKNIRASADSAHRLLEIEGRPRCPVSLSLVASCRDLSRFFEDCRHRLELAGKLTFVLPGHPESGRELEVTGFLELFAERRKPYGLPSHLRRLQREATDYEYLTVKGSPNPAEPRFLKYHLATAGDALRLEGYKRVRNDPGVDAWRDTTALFARLGTARLDEQGRKSRLGGPIDVVAAGVVHVNLTDFVFDELPSFEATGGEKSAQRPQLEVLGTTDPARMAWAAGKFTSFFFGTLQRIYSPQAVSLVDTLLRPHSNGVRHERPLRRGVP